MSPNHYRNGKAREYRVRDDLLAKGWVLVAQTGGSHGPADLVMVHPTHGLALIQVGALGKVIGPQARLDLIRLADLCSALPICATGVPNVGYRYRLVTATPAQSWPEFDPIWGLLGRKP